MAKPDPEFSEKSAEEFLFGLILSIRLEEAKERNRRTKDGFKLPDGVYETLEDIGRIESAAEILNKCWNRDEKEISAVRAALRQIERSLRSSLHELL